MGRYYESTRFPDELRRRFNVYDRIRELQIDLGSRDAFVRSLAGANIAMVVFTHSGLVFLSGAAAGNMRLEQSDDLIARGAHAAAEAADKQIRWLHWALVSGGEGGDLNDVLYTVKALGFVVSDPAKTFRSPAQVVNGYSARWQSVFGGGIGMSASAGIDPGGYAGVHARSALAGLDGGFSVEVEMVIAIPPDLAAAIISNRGWLFPVPPGLLGRMDTEGPSEQSGRYASGGS